MAYLKNLAKKLRIEPPYLHYRRKMEEAIKAGRLAPYCGLERYSPEVERALGGDSLDAAEISIAIEGYGRPVRTVGDLLCMLEEFDSEYEAEDR
jgi:hypothetical protein